ncbi:MAG: hypothetical protein N2109_13005 [Fimbriimonadales bacterium]|nr:hypothetical protein [Fimbriimonadales bacterium]
MSPNASRSSSQDLDWTVDYGDGPRPVSLPHAWRQDVPVTWEGPAVYRASVRVPDPGGWLLFHGVSYEARVSFDGEPAATHRGIWDAFSVRLPDRPGAEVLVEVSVTKNGGPTFPVRDVASGFLPYVFHTFGGIYQPVEVVVGPEDPLASPAPAPPCRVRAEGCRLFVDGKPFYLRGVLTWGWYPEIGHTNPDDATIRHEARLAKRLGFNTIKFCLWVPTHRHLEILRDEGLEAWLELPLWDPSSDPTRLANIAREIERIVLQYRRHPNILVWTVGCELSHGTPHGYRKGLVERVKELTGAALVKDNSGGSEMYGGDLREYGDFYDFHPYCDLPYYPPVLDSLLPGARTAQPVLLGEFNDIDVHRDVARLAREKPYWGSPDPVWNDVGVRWQHDLPRILAECRFCRPDQASRHRRLMESSRRKALFLRKIVHEAVREREPIAGYVVTGWRDTPIATAGMLDDWLDARYSPEEVRPWNGDGCLFLIPTRRPPFHRGGNRPGWLDPFVFREGDAFWKIGASLPEGGRHTLRWRIVAPNGQTALQGSGLPQTFEPFVPRQAAEVAWPEGQAGRYRLEAEVAGCSNAWEFEIVRRPDWQGLGGWTIQDPTGRLEGLQLRPGDGLLTTAWCHGVSEALAAGRRIVCLADGPCTKPAPFWREAAYEFLDEAFWSRLGIAERWERFWAVSPDCVLDAETMLRHLPVGTVIEPLLLRVDTRTYEEAPVLARCRFGEGLMLATTLRPDGGLGMQPFGLGRNPSGADLLARLLAAAADPCSPTIGSGGA